MFGADYLSGHEEGLLTLGFTFDTLLTRIVQAIIVCSIFVSAVISTISIIVMHITGQEFVLHIWDFLFIGGLYLSLFALGRFIGMRTLLLKRNSNVGNYLIEIGYVVLVVVMKMLLPTGYSLTVFVLGTLLACYLLQRYLMQNNWKRFLERSV